MNHQPNGGKLRHIAIPETITMLNWASRSTAAWPKRFARARIWVILSAPSDWASSE
jgi:hypothetical protein